MTKSIKFEKVSLDQFKKDCVTFEVDKVYSDIKIPTRATVGSAGYDFFAPFDIQLNPNQTQVVPTGIRALMPEGWVLMIFPRSGLGFKFRLRLDNTVGIIDSDYSQSQNQGHIFVKITNEGDKVLAINKGMAFVQGVFVRFGLTEDDQTSQQRDGGMGSTDKC